VPERYRIADLQVDAATRQIMREGREIELPGLSFDLLLVLARHAPRVLSAEELMELVWPGRVVNLETVAKRVELVRAALGDDSAEPRYVAVVRGHGYRLVAPVRAAAERRVAAQPVAAPPAPSVAAPPTAPATSAPSGWQRRTLWASAALAGVAAVSVFAWLLAERGEPSGALAPPAEGPSLAVAPFRSLSDDAADAYFADGITEELRRALATVPRLRVASRTSSAPLRDGAPSLAAIARTLNVDHVLEGSVRRADNRIRVTAQLSEVASD
jgi:TolB-like protein/DNA-binding winged helix-turn-helix (wHTH) protein